MRKLLLLTLFLISQQSFAATKWVDLNGVGSGTGLGTDVNNQCAGIGDTDCLGGNLPAGSIQHWCGEYTGAGITLPTAGSAGNVTTYDCQCSGGVNAIIHATSGSAGILANKAYTRSGDYCTVDYTGSKPVQINASNVTIGAVKIVAPFANGITITKPSVFTDITLDGAIISGGTGYGVYDFYSGATTDTITDFIIKNMTITDMGNTGIFIECGVASTACTKVRVTVNNNKVWRNGNTGIVIFDCYDGVDTVGTCGDITTNTPSDFTDFKIYSNDVQYQTAGGGMSLASMVSSTNAFGKNLIYSNISSNNVGPIGGIDVFNSKYVQIYDNQAENNTTATIDANGILVDYGNQFVQVMQNRVYNNVGLPGVDNSGVGIMVIKGNDVDVWANVGSGNKTGFYTSGNLVGESNIRFFNNSFLNNADFGYYADATQDASTVTLNNNILSGNGTCIYAETGGAAQTEDYNILSCTTRKNYNGIAWSDGANSITTAATLVGGGSPLTAEGFSQKPGSVSRQAGKTINQGDVFLDYRSRPFHRKPSIGAREVTSGDLASERTLRTQ